MRTPLLAAYTTTGWLIPSRPPSPEDYKGLSPILKVGYLGWGNLRAQTQTEAPPEFDVQIERSTGEVISPVFG